MPTLTPASPDAQTLTADGAFSETLSEAGTDSQTLTGEDPQAPGYLGLFPGFYPGATAYPGEPTMGGPTLVGASPDSQTLTVE